MALPVGARRQVDEALRSSGLYERARSILKDAATTGRDIFDALREDGLVDDMATVLLKAGVDPATLQKVASVAPAVESTAADLPPSPPAVDKAAQSVPSRQLGAGSRSVAVPAMRMDPSKPVLCIRFGKGKAFLPPAALAGDIAVSSSSGGRRNSRRRGADDGDDDAHSDNDDLDSSGADADAAIALEAASGVRRAYVLHAFCAGQRFQSVPVPVSLEPDFGASDRAGTASVAAEAVASAAAAAAASPDAMASVAATHPQFAVDLQPLLDAGPSPALRRNGGFGASSSSAAAGGAHAALPLARRLLHSTSLEASGLHVVLTMVTDHRAAATAALAASHAPDSPSRRSGAGGAGGAGAGAGATTSGDDESAAGAADAAASAAATAALASAAATSADVSVDVIASHTLDWRTVVAAAGGMMTTLVPLSPAGPGPHPTTADGTGARIPVGLLPVHLALRPLLAPHETLARFDAEHILSRSLAVHRDTSQAFVAHARSFWGDYKAAHPSFRARPVKIFGESERGETLPVPAYVTPMAAGRLLESPFAAARFVSLLPYRRDDSIAGGGAAASRELWHAPHVTLSLRQGDVQAHALLLCSLLLGFGLEAYVALGTRIDASSGAESEYAWVVTRYASAAAPAALGATGSPESHSSTASAASAAVSARVVFWDALTGQRSEPGSASSPAGAPHYHRLAAVFNHECYFANQALDDSVAAVRWGDWGDVTQWKAMSSSLIQALPHAPAPPLSPPTLDALSLSDDVEAALRALLGAHRQRMRLPILETCRQQGRVPPAFVAPSSLLSDATSYGVSAGGAAASASVSEDELAASTAAASWSSALEHRLQVALAAYELERSTGIVAGGDEFASSIRTWVPRGFAFRGFPVLFNHISPARMLQTLLATPVARDIVEAPADAETSFALKVRIHVFPENVTAAWVMIAVCQPVVR